jgi:hypothetical protein
MAQVESLTSSSPDAAAARRTATESGGGALGSTLNAVRDTVFMITDAGVGAYTLAAPTAGIDDGKEFTIIDTTGHAHTVTTPSNVINTNKHIATFGGTLGQQLKLVAQGGTWWVNPSASGITLS